MKIDVKVKLHKRTNHVSYHVSVYSDRTVEPYCMRQFGSYELAYVFIDGLIESRRTSSYEPYDIDPHTLISEAKVVYRNE